jgi:hypothetical protein
MSARRRILLFIGAGILLGGLAILCFPKPPVLQFTHHDQNYFKEFARACDSLLQEHPLGTNIPGDDPLLPPIIRQLRYGVDRVTISTNKVLVIVPAPWHGFGIVWAPQNETDTNAWALTTWHESEPRVAYVERR